MWGEGDCSEKLKTCKIESGCVLVYKKDRFNQWCYGDCKTHGRCVKDECKCENIRGK